MRAFMLSNGFDEVVDIYDFKGSKRYGWGVSDGDLMTMAEEILKSSREKLFLYVVTLSSHEPFLYPEAVVEADKRFKIQGFENSTKYTDYVVGKFLESVDLNSSIVGLIGDHPPKVKSPYPVPVDRFQVFGLILGGQKGVYSGLSSQIDFVPTLLDMGGVSTKLPAFGFSVLKVEPRRAVMAYRKNFALLTEDSFVLYRPEEKPQQFNLNYQPIENNSSTVEKGLSLLYGAEFLYRDREYRVDD
jgi:phosphoglycerol transferase MdoB-like AlkP superfamily enzyme